MLKTWWLQAGKPWLMENLRAVALVAGCVAAIVACVHYEQYIMYALPAVIFGYGIIHGLVELSRNPVKEETKMRQLLTGVKDGLKQEGDFVLHLKHLIEKHLGHSVVIIPAPTVELDNKVQ